MPGLGAFREELEDQPSNVKSFAGALSFFSVGLALGVAYLVGMVLEGWAAWPVSAFLTTPVSPLPEHSLDTKVDSHEPTRRSKDQYHCNTLLANRFALRS